MRTTRVILSEKAVAQRKPRHTDLAGQLDSAAGVITIRDYPGKVSLRREDALSPR